MRLEHSQIRELLKILDEAEISRAEFDLIVNLASGKGIEEYAGNVELPTQMIHVLGAANRQGWIVKLIRALGDSVGQDNQELTQTLTNLEETATRSSGFTGSNATGRGDLERAEPDGYLRHMINREKQVGPFMDELEELSERSERRPISFICSSLTVDKPDALLERIQINEFREYWSEMPKDCIKARAISLLWPKHTKKRSRFIKELARQLDMRGAKEAVLAEHMSSLQLPLIVQIWAHTQTWSEVSEQLAVEIIDFWNNIRCQGQPVCVFYMIQVDREDEKSSNTITQFFETHLDTQANQSPDQFITLPPLHKIQRIHARDWIRGPIASYCDDMKWSLDTDKILADLERLFADDTEQKYLNEVDDKFWKKLCTAWQAGNA